MKGMTNDDERIKMTNKEAIAILTHNWKYRELIDNSYQYEALELAIKALESVGDWKSPKESLPRTTDKTEKYASGGATNFRESDEVLCYLKPKCKMNSLNIDNRFIVARYCRDKNESYGYQTYWYASGDDSDAAFDIEDVIAWSYINKDGLNIEEANS